MMAQYIATVHVVDGTPLQFNNCCLHWFPSNPKLLTQYDNKSCLYFGKFGKFIRKGGLSFTWLGPSKVLSNVAYSSYKAKVLHREEGFPPIQTLRRFPMEELSGKVVMVRFDSSILVHQSTSRASSAFLTIKYIYEAGAKVVLASSWNVTCNDKILPEEAVAEFISSVLRLKVVPAKCISAHQQPKMERFEEADIILLENLSNYKQELANDSDFAWTLISTVDIFVNDSFSTAHKILASTVGVTLFCYACLAGFYFEECLVKLKKIPDWSQSPIVAVVGGGNLKDKAAALRVLASKCDGLVFVGMMALQIMHAMGRPVPLYLVEQGGSKAALEIVKCAEGRGIPILLPSDFLCKHSHLQIQVFLQSDVEEVALRMRKQFLDEGKKLALVDNDKIMIPGPGGWLAENPFGVRSDWERHVLARGAPMYRLMLYKR
ncbi:Phosphoglycerate kinase [Bienertia sinuspersici]